MRKGDESELKQRGVKEIIENKTGGERNCKMLAVLEKAGYAGARHIISPY